MAQSQNPRGDRGDGLRAVSFFRSSRRWSELPPCVIKLKGINLPPPVENPTIPMARHVVWLEPPDLHSATRECTSIFISSLGHRGQYFYVGGALDRPLLASGGLPVLCLGVLSPT